MKELMIMYHPVKKEIRFLAQSKGELLDIPLEMCPRLAKYSPINGEFLLQNQGNQFFMDIWEQFSKEKISLVFKGTKVDYEDFIDKLAEFNKKIGEENITVRKFIELPAVEEIYSQINDFCDETISLFETELKGSDIQNLFKTRKDEFEKVRKSLSNNDINLCFVGTYSAGKSTFINALIGKRILPESINSETAKMFRIQNDETPSISFVLRVKDFDQDINVDIVWDDAKSKFKFTASRECKRTANIIENEINNAVVFHLAQHEQVYQILKCLNSIPNEPTEESTEYVDGIITVHFPIPLDPDLSFTFYDTPGTDSNCDEHLLVLKKALQQQTNSILLIMYEPTKMEGTGNSILYKLINSSRDGEKNKSRIDLSHSLHIINQADTRSLNDLRSLKDLKVAVSLNDDDKVFDEKKEVIDLSKERLFFVSAKAAYISKAIKNNIDTEDERLWLANHRSEINNDKITDPLLLRGGNTDIDTGMYFKLNNMANADNENEQMLEDCMQALKKCDESSDNAIVPILRKIYVNSGMYAVESEIVKYAHKYALAVKAKGLYDGISDVVKFVKDDYEAIETQARLSKQQITDNIETMKTSMVKDFEATYNEFSSSVDKEELIGKIEELVELNAFIDNCKLQAEKVADKMKWIAIRPEVFEEKNSLIRNELNRYLLEIDDLYKNSREKILMKQVEQLKEMLIEKIKGYKGIDDDLVKRIANVSATHVPSSTLKALKMDEYINKEKVIFIFSTSDKHSYKKDVRELFESATRMQYESYISEVSKIAKQKARELINEFRENIDVISSSLELLIKDEKEAGLKQARAKEVLKLVEKRDEELNSKIWGNDLKN